MAKSQPIETVETTLSETTEPETDPVGSSEASDSEHESSGEVTSSESASLEPAVAAAAVEDDPTVCVVNDGRCVGKAGGINGRVCSAHAAQYRRDGTRRE